MDEGGSLERASGGAPSLGTLEDMLRKSPDMAISLYRDPFITKENLVSGGEAHILGTLKDGWGTQRYVKQVLEMDVCFCRSPAFGEHGWVPTFLGPSYYRNFYEVFERYAKCPVDKYLSP